MTHLGTIVLETERLILRPFVVEDAGAMYTNWASDDAVTKYMTWPPHDSVDTSKTILEDWCDQYKEKDYYHWAITLKAQGKEPIGSIGIVYRDDKTSMGNIGYCIGKKWWRQGITSEALEAIIHYLLTEVGMNRIEAHHDPNNPNSGKVMQKCGMRYEGTKREGSWNNQGICDCAMYAVLKKDFSL